MIAKLLACFIILISFAAGQETRGSYSVLTKAQCQDIPGCQPAVFLFIAPDKPEIRAYRFTVLLYHDGYVESLTIFGDVQPQGVGYPLAWARILTSQYGTEVQVISASALPLSQGGNGTLMQKQ